MDYTQNCNTNGTDAYHAMIDMVFDVADNKTILSRCDTTGALATQPPLYPESNGNICHTYLIHPPGGIVGGDVLDIQCTVKRHAHAVITTSDKTKFYRCAEKVASYKQILTIHADAELEYIVQENMFFNGCNAHIDTVIDCKAGGKFMVWVWHCCGQTANTEHPQNGIINGKTVVLMDSKPIISDHILFNADNPLTYQQQDIEYPISASFYISNDTPQMLHDIHTLINNMRLDTTKAIITVSLTDNVIAIHMHSTLSSTTRIAFTTIWQNIRKSRHQSETTTPHIWYM